MISLQNVSKYYPTKNGRKYVLRDVTLAIPAGRDIAILGPNGAGKSTLVRLLGGTDIPNKGKVKRLSNVSWPLGLAAGFQGSMSGRENVRFVARIHGIKHTHILEDQVAAFAEIGRYFDEPIKNYSSGMKSRLAFGLSLAFDFDILLIDEVLSVGDKNFKEKSKAALKAKREKSSIILVSHSLGTLREMCNAGIVIKNAQLHWHEDVESAIQDYITTYG